MTDLERKLIEALRKAPMPYRESTLGDRWDDVYDEWWHTFANEASLERMQENDITDYQV